MTDFPDPNTVELENPSTEFEYFKIAKELDECDEVEMLRAVCKAYIRLYMKQKEVYNKIMRDNLINTDGW
tara:strand:- start:142 stop:351 length:210 start_codon:yes stop_codon:yes gene_type:complete